MSRNSCRPPVPRGGAAGRRALACALLLLAPGAPAAPPIDQRPLLAPALPPPAPPLSPHSSETPPAPGPRSPPTTLPAPAPHRTRLEKQGYATPEQPLKLKIEDTLKETYTLAPASATPGAGAAPGAAGAAAAAPPPAP